MNKKYKIKKIEISMPNNFSQSSVHATTMGGAQSRCMLEELVWEEGRKDSSGVDCASLEEARLEIAR